MKKLLMILLGAMLVLSMAGVASADQTITNAGETINPVPVKLTLGQIYTVVLPSEISLTYDNDHGAYIGKSKISANIVRLNPDHRLDISVKSDYYDTDADEWMLYPWNTNTQTIDKTQDGLAYKLGYGSEAQHIDSSTPAEIIDNNVNFVSRDDSFGLGTTDSPLMYIHAKAKVDDTLDLEEAAYMDSLVFTVSVNDYGQSSN